MSSEALDQFMGYLVRQELGQATVSLYHGAVRRALEGAAAGRDLLDVLGDPVLGSSRKETYRKALFHWASFREDPGLTERLRAWTPGRRPQRKKGPARALDIDTEWLRLRRAVLCHEDPFLSATLYLIGTTGLRIAEVLDLTGADLRAALRTGAATILQKGKKERLVTFPTAGMREQATRLADELEDVQRVEDLLHTHRRLTRKGVEDYVRRELQQLVTNVGIVGKVTPHVCRRTVGDAVYEKTHDPRAVAEVLGHDPGSRTTQRWYQDHVRKNAGADALRAAVGEDNGKDR